MSAEQPSDRIYVPGPYPRSVRRIYESDAVVRDGSPHTPRERDDDTARTHVNWGNVSHAFMPVRLRDWAIVVDVETNCERYAVGEPVGIQVQFRNRLPTPIRLRTASPVLWQWAVGDALEASLLERDTPDKRGALSFARRERKTFTRTWHQTIRQTEREWVPVDPGEFTISAWINVDDPDRRGLTAETTVTIER